jgi:hypothetical protein
MFPQVYGDITLEAPRSHLSDQTVRLKKWNTLIQSHDLGNLRDACNDLLIPDISCPWGCTDYIHKSGTVEFDVILQRLLLKYNIPWATSKTFKNVVGIRDDYLREENDHDMWLMNPNWIIMPSLIITEGKGPRVMTCRFHNNGANGYMIHQCRQPNHIFPPKNADQLAHCVICPRTIKPMKNATFSNSYQMHEQRGSFNGIDTCSVNSFGKFDFCSLLSMQDEARAIKNRPDVRGLLSQLVEEKVISRYTANMRMKEAEEVTRGIRFDKYWKGATYVPLQTCMSIQAELNPDKNTIDVEVQIDENVSNICFERPWPTFVHPCQNLTSYGIMPPTIPDFKVQKRYRNTLNKSCQRGWIVASIMLHVEPIWRMVSSMVSYKRLVWKGWMLMYLTRKTLHAFSKTQSKLNPFKFNQITNTKALCSKIEHSICNGEHTDMFGEVESIRSLSYLFQNEPDLQQLIDADEEIQNKHHEVIIIFDYYRGTQQSIPQSFKVNQHSYDICFISELKEVGDDWTGLVHSRHSSHNEGWWSQQRMSRYPIKSSLPNILNADDKYTLVFIKEVKPDIMSSGMDLMTYIGGQKHALCHRHKLPLIMSTFRKRRCECGRKEYYCCRCSSCLVAACKKCVDDSDINSITYFGANMDGSSNSESTERSDTEVDSDDNTETTERSYSEVNSDNDDPDNHVERGERNVSGDLSIELTEAVMDDHITNSLEPDVPDSEDDNETDFIDYIPGTNTGVRTWKVVGEGEKTGYFADITISGNVLLNQCGTLLTRKSHQIRGSSRGKYFLQRICSSHMGKSIPLLQPEAMLFPSKFWKMVPHDVSILGAIPSALLNEKIRKYGFQELPVHIRSRLTSSSSSTSTDPRYIAFCFDILSNLSAVHMDTRVAMFRGLTAGDDTLGGLSVRGGNEGNSAALLGSIDSVQMVKNLCAAQYHHPMDYFLTFTCNQSKHFGTKNIKNWIDSYEWTKFYPSYKNLNKSQEEEIKTAIDQAAAGLLLRNWQETCELFLHYLRHSPTSPYKGGCAIFARHEYQKKTGNLSHIHLMIQIDWKNLSESETKSLDELIRASICDIARIEDMDNYIRDGIISNIDEQKYIHSDAEKYLSHKCDSRCMTCVAPGKYRCRKMNYLDITPNNTKNNYLPFPNELPETCKLRLEQIDLIEPIVRLENGFEKRYNQ